MNFIPEVKSRSFSFHIRPYSECSACLHGSFFNTQKNELKVRNWHKKVSFYSRQYKHSSLEELCGLASVLFEMIPAFAHSLLSHNSRFLQTIKTIADIFGG